MGKGGVDGIWLFVGLTSYVGRYEMIDHVTFYEIVFFLPNQQQASGRALSRARRAVAPLPASSANF